MATRIACCELRGGIHQQIHRAREKGECPAALGRPILPTWGPAWPPPRRPDTPLPPKRERDRQHRPGPVVGKPVPIVCRVGILSAAGHSPQGPT